MTKPAIESRLYARKKKNPPLCCLPAPQQTALSSPLVLPSTPTILLPSNNNNNKQQHSDSPQPVLLRHDSDFSVNTNYHDASPNDLTAWQGAVLLTAECLGTGLLALPGDIHVLGFGFGMAFLLINLPINLAAGTVLSLTASLVEDRQKMEDRLFQAALASTADEDWDQRAVEQDYRALNELTAESAFTVETTQTSHTRLHHDTATYDFIGMTMALFRSPRATRYVQLMYYTNLFLVLGNYILVMSHAVVAVSGESLCLPAAGGIASIGMFAVAQLRTMASLGRTASVLSLAALLVVVVQCLVAARSHEADTSAALTSLAASTAANSSSSNYNMKGIANVPVPFLLWSATTLLKKLSALGSIGFAVGSQKLLLNIRHELIDRKHAPRTLLYGLSAFGSVYVLIILLAGPNPPSFLFDAIPVGSWNRRVAGLLLWGHVMVSYAINSQAICASLERLVSPRIAWLDTAAPATRWMTLSGCLAILAYTVANAIPFFDDLVALIGALTSVPLTLLLPALFWRKQGHYPLWKPTWDSLSSWTLLWYATIFMITATIGTLWSIRQDWATYGAPFAC